MLSTLLERLAFSGYDPVADFEEGDGEFERDHRDARWGDVSLRGRGEQKGDKG